MCVCVCVCVCLCVCVCVFVCVHLIATLVWPGEVVVQYQGPMSYWCTLSGLSQHFTRAVSRYTGAATFGLGCLGIAILYRIVSRFLARLVFWIFFFTEISPIWPEGSPIPLFKAIVYSKSVVRKLLSMCCVCYCYKRSVTWCNLCCRLGSKYQLTS